MKKVVGFLCLLLAPFAVSQFVSLRHFSELRAWVSGRSSQEVLVGACWPFETNQDGMSEGLGLAQEEINSRGIRGKRIRLLLRDDHLDREESRSIAVDFARTPGMAATIGYYDDNFAVRASAIFEESRLLHIVIGANNTYMTGRGFRYLIRTVLPGALIGRKLARLCLERGYRKFASIAEDGPFGEDLAYQFETELDTADAQMVYKASYVRGKVDFRETVDALKATQADVIIFAGLEAEAAAFIKAARGMGLNTPIVGSFDDLPELHKVPEAVLEGVMFYSLYNVDSPSPENRAFVAKYRRRFGRAPGVYAAQGYDALRILAKAVETTGSTNSLDLSYAIRFMDRWEGVNGPYQFDSNGELKDKDLFLMAYHHGRAELIATSRKDTSPLPE